MMKFFIFLTIAFAIALSCKPSTPEKLGSSDSASTTPTTTTVPSGAPTVSAAAPLALSIKRKYADTTTQTEEIFDETGTTVCEATTANPVVTCTLSIPEAQL